MSATNSHRAKVPESNDPEWRFARTGGEFHLMWGTREILSFRFDPRTTYIAMAQRDEAEILSRLNAPTTNRADERVKDAYLAAVGGKIAADKWCPNLSGDFALIVQKADTVAEKALPFAIGRLQALRINHDVLRSLKRELANYNTHTARWKS